MTSADPENGPEDANVAASEPDFVAEGVVRTRRRGASRPAPRSDKPPTPVGTRAMWVLAIGLGAGSIAPMLAATAGQIQTYSLTQASAVDLQALLAAGPQDGASLDYLETLSEMALAMQPPENALALPVAERVVAIDPSRAFAWANIAWLKYLETHTVNSDVVAAIGRSMDACALCDQSLVRWRFNFVLANWDRFPEVMRQTAFEHADMLRWRGDNVEFLAEMRTRAVAKGIPFDAYRAGVKTPKPSWETQAPVVPETVAPVEMDVAPMPSAAPSPH